MLRDVSSAAHAYQPGSALMCRAELSHPATSPSTGSCTHLQLLPRQLPGQLCWRCHLMQPWRRLQPLPHQTSSSRKQPWPLPGSGPLLCHQWRLPRQTRMRRLHRCHLLAWVGRRTHGARVLQHKRTIRLAAAETTAIRSNSDSKQGARHARMLTLSQPKTCQQQTCHNSCFVLHHVASRACSGVGLLLLLPEQAVYLTRNH